MPLGSKRGNRCNYCTLFRSPDKLRLMLKDDEAEKDKYICLKCLNLLLKKNITPRISFAS